MAELSNCPKCGRLFVKNLASICNECRKEEEKKFEIVYQYIRKKENRTATVTEISEATGVEEELIMKFVKEGRLRPTHFPNLGYPCDRCGKQIQRGKLCDQCQEDIKVELNKYDKEKERIEREKKEVHTYIAIDEKYRKR